MARFGLMTVIASLALVSATNTVEFLERTSACWHLRLPPELRPPCCSLAGKTRVTPPGGDCCKQTLLPDSDDARASADLPSVPPARLDGPMPFARERVVARQPQMPPPAARGPPPRPFHPTRTTILRV